MKTKKVSDCGCPSRKDQLNLFREYMAQVQKVGESLIKEKGYHFGAPTQVLMAAIGVDAVEEAAQTALVVHEHKDKKVKVI